MKTLKCLLQLMPALPTSSTYSQSEAVPSTSTASSKMMTKLIKPERKRNMNIFLERTLSDEIFYYFHVLKLRVLVLML